MLQKVFVYGSLKRGFGNHNILRESGASFLGKHKTAPEFTMISLGGFPGLLCEGDTEIEGEVYEVNEKGFQALDWLEGYPNFYDRKIIDSPFGPCWVYFLHDNESRSYRTERVVASGVWEGGAYVS